MSSYNKELSTTIKIVKKASDITEWFQNKGFESFEKKDNSPVTFADFASQIYIISELKEIFPNDQLIAEENESSLIDKKSEIAIRECFEDLGILDITDFKSELKYRGSPSERQWTIDPIDGTAGFQKGLSYAIGVSLMEQSVPKVCAIGVPNYNEKGLGVFCAEQDQGAKASYGGKDFVPIKVSEQIDLKKAKLVHSLHFDIPWVIQLAEKIGLKERIQLDSMKKFCMVADGTYDLYIKPIMGYQAASWDFCPGDLLVREANGLVTDLDEQRLRFEDDKCLLKSPGIIATNKVLHNEIAHHIRDNFFSI